MPDDFRSRIPGPAEWRAVVKRRKGLSGETRATLLAISLDMNHERKVSIPQRTLAADFDVSTRTIRGRIEEAHEHGLLTTVVHGKPGTTAVYQGVFPSTPHVRDGAHKGRPELVLEGAHKQTPKHVRDVVPPSSKHVQPEAVELPTLRSVAPSLLRSDDESNNPSCHRDEVEVVKHVIDEVDGGTPKGTPKLGSGTAVAPAADGSAEVLNGRAGKKVRGRLLDLVQLCAADDGYPSTELADLLDEVYGWEVGAYVMDQWHVDPKCAISRYAAGVELNKMVNTARSAA